MDYILDSNTVIDFVGKRLPEKAIDKIDNALINFTYVSVITQIEVFGFNGTELEMGKYEEIFTGKIVIDLGEKIINNTIALRKQYSKIKLPDLIIAATALEYNLTLVTHNLNDFKNIQGLQIIDSHLL